MEFKKLNKRTRGKNEGEEPRNRLLAIENKMMITRRGVDKGMGEIGMGLKECFCFDGHWVTYGSNESRILY